MLATSVLAMAVLTFAQGPMASATPPTTDTQASVGARTVTPGQPGDQPLALTIRVRVEGEDGRTGMSAGGDADSSLVEGYIWSDARLCQVGAGKNEPASPEVGWRYRGRVIEQQGDDLVVEIEWERLWQEPTPPLPGSGLTGSMRVTLRWLDTLELDRIEGTGDRCNIMARLEASVDVDRKPSIASPLARLRENIAAAQSTRAATGGGRGGLRGGSGSGAAGTTDAAVYTADIWLVHTRPDETESVQQQTVTFSLSGRPFSFPPIRFDADGATLTIEVSGRLRFTLTNGDPTKLEASLRRAIERDGRIVYFGETAEIEVPLSGEVIAYELPNPRTGAGGHRFEVRFRTRKGGSG